MSLENNLKKFREVLQGSGAHLIAVSKTYSAETIFEAYHLAQRAFGENKVQELVGKYKILPDDIQWHLIGHLQSNKVKDIAPFIFMIHSVDSLKLLREINKEGKKKTTASSPAFFRYILLRKKLNSACRFKKQLIFCKAMN